MKDHGSLTAKTVRDVWQLFKTVGTPYIRRQMGIGLLIGAFTSILAAIGPVALKWLVDTLASPRPNPRLAVIFILAYVGTLWASRTIGALQTYVQARADRRIYRALSDRYFSHVIRLPLRFHLNKSTGAVSETLTNGLAGFQIVTSTVMSSIVPIVVQLTIICGVLLSLRQGILLAMLLIASIAYAVAYSQGTRKSSEEARTASEGQIDARALMTDGILNYEAVKYFSAERAIRFRVEQALIKSEIAWLRFFYVRATNAALVGTIFAVFLASALIYAMYQVSAGAMTVGSFVLINAYILQLIAPIEMVGAAAQAIAQGLAYLEKMFELLRETAEPDTSDDAPMLEGAGRLEFQNVTAGYTSNGDTLHNVSFVLPARSTLGIVGASGAGKTSLVRLLTRLIEPTSGRILIDDVGAAELELASVRGAIAVVPQDTVLFRDTIANNIAFGRAECSREEIESAAKIARLHDFILRLPEGYATRVGERGVRLSGGEKQRVSIARAALKRPKIFVFDEATSSLDSRTEREILVNIQELSRHATTVIIAHRLSTVVHADQIIVLDQGAIVERGTHAELVRQGGQYAALWSAQNQTPSVA